LNFSKLQLLFDVEDLRLPKPKAPVLLALLLPPRVNSVNKFCPLIFYEESLTYFLALDLINGAPLIDINELLNDAFWSDNYSGLYDPKT